MRSRTRSYVLTADCAQEERFDHDPGWEGHDNRIVLKSMPTVRQDFGYSATHFAGEEQDELSGRITRTTRPAYHVAKIAPKTLADKLTASSSFAVTASQPSAGVFLAGSTLGS